MKPIIAVENSTWNNIGDAFYQSSLFNILTRTFPQCEIVVFDGPGERAFRPGRSASRMFDSRPFVVADHYVFSGPILNPKFTSHYGRLIEKIRNAGATYSLFSTHFWQNHKPDPLLDFLGRNPPLAVHTRDAPSFELLEGLCDCALNGACFAFFVSKIPHISTLTFEEPTLAVSYYRGPEPAMEITPADGRIVEDRVSVTPKKSRNWRIERHLEFRKTHPERLGAYKIVRPVHSFYPFAHLIFNRPDSYITYNPLNMLALYKSVDGVLTDRVHSGVAALSFGKPAWVERVDDRFALFDRVPFEHKNGFFLPNPDAIEVAYQRVTDWLKGPFAETLGFTSAS